MRSRALVVVLLLILLSGQKSLAQSATDGERLEIAWSGWRAPDRGKVVAEGLRVTTADGTQTIGRVSVRSCVQDICAGSSVIRVIDNDAFEIDPLLSAASLEFGIQGETQVVEWHAKAASPPHADMNGADPRLGRDASATGDVNGHGVSDEDLRNARIIAGASAPSAIPLVPPTPPDLLMRSGPSLLGSCWTVKEAERAFATAHNLSRTSQGLGRLRLDPELSRVARAHTRDMVNQDILHHSTSLQLRRRISNWIVLGENVGVGGTPDSLMQAFMDSPGHRANILHGPFKYFGVGTKSAGGRLWVTVIFEAENNPSTSMRMPRC